MSDVDIPDRLKHSDNWLDWISNYKAEWEERLAGEEAERAITERLTLWVATIAETMVNAPVGHRRQMVAAIQRELREYGIWPPLDAPDK